MRVNQVMIRALPLASPDQPIREAARIMARMDADATASDLLGLVAGTLVCFMGMTFSAVAGTGSDAMRVCRLRSMWWAKAQEDAGPMPKPTLEPASPLCRLHRFP